MLVWKIIITPESGWFLAFKADCFATFGKLLLSNNLPLGHLALKKKHSQRNKRTTTNTETQCQCRVWIWTASQGGWPTWANMPWDRRKPCAMPPQWCHKSPADVKQFYNMTAPNSGSSLSVSSWIHMNVSQTTNISTHWLMIPSQVINQWATSVVYGWYWVVTVSLCKCWSSCPGRNWRTAWWSSTLQDPGPDPRRRRNPYAFQLHVNGKWTARPAMWWSPSYPHLTLRKEQQRGLLCSQHMSRLS